MYRINGVCLAFVLALFGAACATGGATISSDATAAKSAQTDENRITAAEIADANLPNAYELVSRLRRPWLRRDPRTGGEVVVYMDEQNIGGASKLREIPAVEVGELQFVPYDDAIRRWGMAVKGSVIVVIRRR